MTTQEIDRKFAELAGICWHDWEYEVIDGFTKWVCSKCHKFRNISDPDPNNFCGDPRLVLREMDRIGKLVEFLASLNCRNYIVFTVYYILDTTGKLALSAIEWLQQQNERSG
jgi:hypothetical protein